MKKNANLVEGENPCYMSFLHIIKARGRIFERCLAEN